MERFPTLSKAIILMAFDNGIPMGGRDDLYVGSILSRLEEKRSTPMICFTQKLSSAGLAIKIWKMFA